MKTDALIKEIATEADRREVIDLLDQLEENLFKTQGSSEELLNANKKFGRAIAEVIGKTLTDTNKEVVSDAIHAVQNEIKRLKKIEVILAQSPSEKITKAISSWAQTEAKKIVVEVSVKPEIIGGAIIIIDGMYHDYSLAKKLEDAFSNKRDEINKLISN